MIHKLSNFNWQICFISLFIPNIICSQNWYPPFIAPVNDTNSKYFDAKIDKTSTDTINQIDSNDKKQGYWIVFWSDRTDTCTKPDQKIEEGYYKDSQKTGFWKEYFCNGNVKSKIFYKNNRPDGYAIIYYENGKIKEEGTWKNNKWAGHYKEYSPNGEIKEFNFGPSGKREGEQTYGFYHSGIEGNWEEGKEPVEITEYYENGDLNSIKESHLPYAKQVVNKLASNELKGRGYVQNGNTLAAEYISKEFEKAGLKSFTKNYYQSFTTPVNTFPESMSVSINNTSQLKPGIDFLIDAGSPGISGTFKTIQITIDDLLKDDRLKNKLKTAGRKFLIIEAYNKKEYNKEDNKKIEDNIGFLKYSAENPAAGTVILTKDKLTWDASTIEYTKPSITVKVDSLSPIIENITLDIQNKFIKKFEDQNLIGFVEGKRNDSLIVFIAHYDHLGMMGNQTIFPGANDNASGIAMLSNLAKYYAENKPEYTTVFIAFGGEEIGLVGSDYFTEHPLFELKKIKFLINFDLAGTGDEGIQIVNGTIYKDKFDKISKINQEMKLLPQVKIRGEACNSDHCMFYRKKVPCFFIYTLGGIQAYHDIYDKAETLPFTQFDNYFKLIVQFVKEL